MKGDPSREIIFETGPLPMEYGACLDRPTHLALGSYRGLGFAVQNMNGEFPCAYIDVAGTSFEQRSYLDLDIAVHGGLSYYGKRIAVIAGGWWVGWDYAHVGDAVFCKDGGGGCAKLFDGVWYSTEKIVGHCTSVIDQLLEMEKKKEKSGPADLET